VSSGAGTSGFGKECWEIVKTLRSSIKTWRIKGTFVNSAGHSHHISMSSTVRQSYEKCAAGFDGGLYIRVSIFLADVGESQTYSATDFDVARALAILAILTRCLFVGARGDNSIASESNVIVQSLVIALRVLEKTSESFVCFQVVPRCAEDGRRPITLASHWAAPGTGFIFGNTLLVDIILRRRRKTLPNVVLALIRAREETALPRAQCEWKGHGFSAWPKSDMVKSLDCITYQGSQCGRRKPTLTDCSEL